VPLFFHHEDGTDARLGVKVRRPARSSVVIAAASATTSAQWPSFFCSTIRSTETQQASAETQQANAEIQQASAETPSRPAQPTKQKNRRLTKLFM